MQDQRDEWWYRKFQFVIGRSGKSKNTQNIEGRSGPQLPAFDEAKREVLYAGLEAVRDKYSEHKVS